MKEGYESRVDFILSELSEATGLELDRNKLLEEGYQSLCGEIDNLIQKKRAEATLSAMESEYTDALQKKQEAAEEYRQTLELLAEVEADYEEKLAQYEDHKAGKGNMLPGEAMDLERELQELSDLRQSLQDEAASAGEAVVQWDTTISQYEGLAAAIIEGDAEKINAAMTAAMNNLLTAETGTEEALRAQAESYQTYYEQMAEAAANGEEYVTEEMLADAKNLADVTAAELEKFESVGADAVDEMNQNTKNALQEGAPDVQQAMDSAVPDASGYGDFGEDAAQQASDSLDTTAETIAGNTSIDEAVQEQGQNLQESLSENLSNVDVGDTGTDIFSSIAENITSLSENLELAGAQAVTAFVTGVSSMSENINSYGASIVTALIAGMPLEEGGTLQSAGSAVVTSFVTGVASMTENLNSYGTTMVSALVAGVEMSDTSSLQSAGAFSVTAFVTGIASMTENLNSYGVTIVSALIAGMEGESEALTQEAALLVETIASGILSRQALVLQRGQSIARQLQRAMKLISFVPVGKQYMAGVASGLSSGSGTVYSRVRAIARGMVNAMKAELDIHSPSRVTRKEIGPDFLRGIPAGMEDALPEAEQSIADSTAAMVARAKQTVNAQLQNASFRSAGVSLVDERIQQHNGSDEKVIAWLQRIEHAVRAGAVLTVDGRVLGQTSLKYQQKMSRVTGR